MNNIISAYKFKGIRTWKIILAAISVIVMTVCLTGCQSSQSSNAFTNRIFGKKFIMIDEFFDQLEADISYSFDKYLAEHQIDNEEFISQAYDILKADMKASREGYKAGLQNAYDLADEYSSPAAGEAVVNAIIDKMLLEERQRWSQDLQELGITLESTELKRGFAASAWLFFRKHWIIVTIVVFIIGTKIEDMLS
ncbi:MAG: hypothetical protein IJ446_01955 [Oscillospiraceae bacterium]|nr:hypothetical protein [Oscillospiraceae bacterium]